MYTRKPVHLSRGLIGLLCGMTLIAVGCGSTKSSTGGHSNAAPAPASTSPSSPSSSSAPAGSGTVAVAYRNIAIDPAQITVKAGTTVKWTNHDGGGIEHNVTVQSGPQTFSSPSLTQGKTFSFKLLKPGVYHYLCTFHPASMIGTITVQP